GHMPYEYDGAEDLPHLSEMTTAALRVIEKDPDGYFIMIEGGRIDHAGHKNDLQRNVLETIEFSRAVQAAFDMVKDRGDTLIIVTADHETGGLKVIKNNGKGKLPDVKWSTKDHTASEVPLYAWGVSAEMALQIKDNTQIFSWATAKSLSSALVSKAKPEPAAASAE
ncbi:MAG: hypothetical protein E4H40_03905, partial [Candidatus Brocadiia bacterium]